MPSDPETLADQLLATPEQDWSAWCDRHAALLSLNLIAVLKGRSDALNRSNLSEAERITRAARAVAEHMALPDQTLALAQALWARGNWAVYTHLEEAVVCYQVALDSYERSGNAMAIGRITSNLVFAYTSLGTLEQALAAAERAHRLLRALGPDGEPFRVNLGVNYGWLLYECGRYTEALASNAATMELARHYGKLIEWAELQVNQAFTLGMVGRIGESEALLLDSRARLAEQGHWLTVARIDMNLAELASSLGRPTQALVRFRQARDTFEDLGVVMDSASVLLFEAELLVRLGALQQARHVYDQARKRFAAEGLSHYAAMALLAGAAVRRSRDPKDPHIPPMLAEATALFASLNLPLSQTEADLERAALALDLGDLALAEALLSHLLPPMASPNLAIRHQLLCASLARHQGQPETEVARLTEALALSQAAALIWLQREAHAQLGRCLVERNPPQAAIQLESAAQIDESIRAELSVAELTASFQARSNDVLPLLVALAVAERRPLVALRYAWRWSGAALLDLLAVHTAARTASPPDADLELLRQQVATLRWQLARAAQDDESPTYVERLRARRHNLEQHYLERRRSLRQAEVGDPFRLPADPRTVLARLDADLLIEYVFCDGNLLALCADRDGNASATMLGSVDILDDLLSAMGRKNLKFLRLDAEQRITHGERLTREAQSVLQKLYAFLIASLPDLPASGRLLIAPGAPLHLVPFAALWDGASYLVERYEVELIPSGALQAVPSPPVGLLGPPLVIGSSAQGALGSVATEIRAVAAALPGCTAYLDDPTTLEHLIALRQAPRILHISAHTEFEAEPSIFSSLQLAGAMLTIERCYDLCLRGTELVVLNGCTTAAGMDSGGALLAFQSALLVAGARRVLSSLWPVHDALAAEVMRVFYRYLQPGQSPSAALRAAQRDLLTRVDTAHPAVWAAFAVIRR